MRPAPRPAPGRQPGVRDFSVFAVAQFCTFCATWMQKTAIGWLIWELSHSPAWVGAIALSDLFAAVLVGPLSGAVTDRINPYRLIQATQLALTGSALALWALLEAGLVTPWLLLLWAIANACILGFNQPVRIVVIGSLAPPGRMGQAIAANSVAANLGRVFGPALAGVIMLRASVASVLLANSVLYLAMPAVVLVVRGLINRPQRAVAPASLFVEVARGFGYVRRDARMSALFLLVISFSFLVRPFAEMFPALVGDVFHGDAGMLALFLSSQGLGALVGAAWLLRPRPDRALLPIIGAAAAGIGIALILLALASALWFALGAVALAGFFHVTCNIGMQTTAQVMSRPAMRGRVVALYMLLFRAAPAAGAFVLGLLGEWLDLQWLIGAGAGIFLILLLLLLPRFRRAFAF